MAQQITELEVTVWFVQSREAASSLAAGLYRIHSPRCIILYIAV